MNYQERAQKIANDYALGVCNRAKPNLVKMISKALIEVARDARKEGREKERYKIMNAPRE